MKAIGKQLLGLEICILAGGLSARMGRDKSRVRLGRRTMLGHIRASARQLGFATRALRRDSISRSGPIGGIYTALQRSKADAVLFMACDMPFVSAKFLQRIVRALPPSGNALFVREGGLAGFPCLLRRENCLPLVSQQIARSELSLQALAKVLKARMLRPSRAGLRELTNINTPEDLKTARQRINRAKPSP
ncbi:MAG TPA: molybdenum cofactor guanylyltransferase [Verrucomicrobiae bacterium]|nr:molybdenum cofactor guanylyltransferase [Verrucomicrobiae bacterium]